MSPIIFCRANILNLLTYLRKLRFFYLMIGRVDKAMHTKLTAVNKINILIGTAIYLKRIMVGRVEGMSGGNAYLAKINLTLKTSSSFTLPLTF